MIGSYWAWCLFVASSYKRYDISLFDTVQNFV